MSSINSGPSNSKGQWWSDLMIPHRAGIRVETCGSAYGTEQFSSFMGEFGKL